MFIDKKYCPSQEAISYQGTSLFLKELTLAVQSMIDTPMPKLSMIEDVGLSKIVKRHTGMTVDFRLDLDMTNAYYTPVILDVNNPILARFRVYGKPAEKELEQMRLRHNDIIRLTRELRGSIDRANGRVTGVFSKIPSTIYVGAGLWSIMEMTASEIAAIILHELGHAFSFFETLTQTATTNMVLASAAQLLDGTEDAEMRLHLVFETAEELNLKVEDPHALAKVDTKGETFTNILLKAQIDRPLVSDSDSFTYDLRSSEFLADQFATRYGAGRELVVALDKLMRKTGEGHRRSMAMHLAVEATRSALLIVVAVGVPVFAGIVATFFLINSHWMDDEYDEPGARFGRIKQDLVQALKNPKLDRQVRQQILLDIEVIDQLREDVKDRYSYFTYLWLAMTSRRRKQFSQMRLQQELEALANNNLYVQASKLSHMAGVGPK